MKNRELNKSAKETAPYLIAEAGMNHEGSMDLAKEMIHAASDSGWDAIKFQTYSADELASASSSPAYWDTNLEPETSQHRLFSKFRKFTPDEHDELEELAKSIQIDFLTTFFYENDLREFGAKYRYVKIASADITNVPLLRAAASTGKPVLLSCGAANDKEIESALEILSFAGCMEITLLHCVLNYPTQPQNANLWRIQDLVKFNHVQEVGYSDHTPYDPNQNVFTPAIAVALGATVIEKHFTLDRTRPGNDHYHSADPEGLFLIRKQIESTIELLGESNSDFLMSQDLAIQNARRRIFSSRALQAGEILRGADLIPLRASFGIEVVLWDTVIGRKLNRSVQAGEPIDFSYLE